MAMHHGRILFGDFSTNVERRPDIPRNAAKAQRVFRQWYEAQWEGGTVVGVEPRGQRYPLFDRGSMQQEDAKLQRSLFADQEGGPVHW
jgi:hypothetical protein